MYVSLHIVCEVNAVGRVTQHDLGPQASQVDNLRHRNGESIADHAVNSLRDRQRQKVESRRVEKVEMKKLVFTWCSRRLNSTGSLGFR